MSKKAEVITLWKSRGLTMGDVLKQFRNKNPIFADVPITYAGRLDPMAEGLVVLLVGNTRFKKDAFLTLPKTYTFECLWGISTDTYDVLGLVESVSYPSIDEKQIQHCVDTIAHMKEQLYPPYSSKPVSGKPLFLWAREGNLSEIVVPKTSINITSLTVTGMRQISSFSLQKEVEEAVGTVSGDFRQEEIVFQWKEVLKKEGVFFISQMKAEVSSGTYIRGLAHSMGACLQCGALAMNITRVRMGDMDRNSVSNS
jgi:tRNA pseudouridine55 synthase